MKTVLRRRRNSCIALARMKNLFPLKDVYAIEPTSTLFLKLPEVPMALSTIPGEDFFRLATSSSIVSP